MKKRDAQPALTDTAPATVNSPEPRGLTKWQKLFLRVLRQTPSVKDACAAARVSRSTAYRHKEHDQAFAEKWNEALQASVDDLEKVAFRLARDGDANLIQFLLRSHRPETYNPAERHEVLGGFIVVPAKEKKEP